MSQNSASSPTEKGKRHRRHRRFNRKRRARAHALHLLDLMPELWHHIATFLFTWEVQYLGRTCKRLHHALLATPHVILQRLPPEWRVHVTEVLEPRHLPILFRCLCDLPKYMYSWPITLGQDDDGGGAWALIASPLPGEYYAPNLWYYKNPTKDSHLKAAYRILIDRVEYVASSRTMGGLHSLVNAQDRLERDYAYAQWSSNDEPGGVDDDY